MAFQIARENSCEIQISSNVFRFLYAENFLNFPSHPSSRDVYLNTYRRFSLPLGSFLLVAVSLERRPVVRYGT